MMQQYLEACHHHHRRQNSLPPKVPSSADAQVTNHPTSNVIRTDQSCSLPPWAQQEAGHAANKRPHASELRQHGITALDAHHPPAPKASGLPIWNHSAGRSPSLRGSSSEHTAPCLREALGSNDQCHTCSTLRPPPPRAMGSKKQHIQRSTRITLRLQGALSSGSTPPPHPQGALGLKQQHKGLKAYIQPPIPSKSRPWHTPGS